MGVCLQKEKIGNNVSSLHIYKGTINSKISLQETRQLRKEK